ncbi:glycosyltransferase family 2 protein [Photorhabdus akhurstii]|uniref:glycosyltransferase family 2 protein n=1 Tax=Photorhabdus akhurstii TaxID=171438 RepID=UPI003703FC0F
MHNDKSLVSILIPVYNREKYIDDAIHSALNQTYQNIEVIIVDNASKDRTWDICTKYAAQDKRVRIFRNNYNLGPVNNWKKCFEYAKGEYAKILWSDDLIASTYIEETMSFFSKETALVFSSVIIGEKYDRQEKTFYRYGTSGHYPSYQFLDDLLFNRNVPVSPGCALFRLTDLRNNLVSEIESPTFSDFCSHGAGPDLLLFLKTAIAYHQIAFIDKPLVFFRDHKESISITMKRIDLFDRYQQARLWFASCHQTPDTVKKLSSLTWVQRMIITRSWNNRGTIRKLYGEYLPAPSLKLSFFQAIISIIYIIKGKIKRWK